MQPITTPQSGVTAGIAQLASGLVQKLLAPRVEYLNHRAPKSRRVHQLRRNIAAGRRRIFEMLLDVAFADVDDGIPPALVAAPYLDLIALINLRAEQRANRQVVSILGHPLALIERRDRVQHKARVVEMRIAANPDCVVSLDERIALSAEHDDADRLLVANLRSRRAHLTLSGRAVG